MIRDATERLVRPMAAAGTFYPSAPDRLAAMVGQLYEAAAARSPVPEAGAAAQVTTPVGILVPHAGLAYSGATAAAAWACLCEPPGGRASPVTVVILGTNHGAAWLDGLGVWPAGAWSTPLGQVAVDEELAAAVVGLGDAFTVDPVAHLGEHSIEVQLPLLLAVDSAARIVPLAVSLGTGTRAIAAGERLGCLLAGLRREGRSVVLAISTDMAHYPPAAACEEATHRLLPPIVAVDPGELATSEADVREADVPWLVCGMCGIEPAVVGLAALRAMGATRGSALAASTSADAGGPTRRTVGYLAVRFDG